MPARGGGSRGSRRPFRRVPVPKAVGELERAEPPRLQSVEAGDRRRDFSLVLLREDRRSSRNHQRDT
jgi:hypothetical protein